MIKAIMISLVLGVLYATVGVGNEQVELCSSLSDITLVILMFSVGISVGANKQVISKIK